LHGLLKLQLEIQLLKMEPIQKTRKDPLEKVACASTSEQHN